MESKPAQCSSSYLPEIAPPQLQHTYLEATVPDAIVSSFPNINATPKQKQSKNTSALSSEPLKWIAQANKISTQLPNKACKLYLDAAKELASQHNIHMASEALHSLVVTSSAEKLTAKAHLLLARLLRVFDVIHSSYHYECAFKAYFSLTPCGSPPMPSISSLSSQSSSTPSSLSSLPKPALPSPPSIPPPTISSPDRSHPPLPPRSHLMRDSRAWAAALAHEISLKSKNDSAPTVNDDESTPEATRTEPTTNEQIRGALECVVEAGKFSQDNIFASIVCDICGTCEAAGIFEKIGIKSDVNWALKAAEKYYAASVYSHSIDALLDAYLKSPSEMSLLLKALSRAVIIDDRVRVRKLLQILSSANENNPEVQCLADIARAHADADVVALEAVANTWRSVLAVREDASDAFTCAQYHLSY